MKTIKTTDLQTQAPLYDSSKYTNEEWTEFVQWSIYEIDAKFTIFNIKSDGTAEEIASFDDLETAIEYLNQNI